MKQLVRKLYLFMNQYLINRTKFSSPFSADTNDNNICVVLAAGY